MSRLSVRHSTVVAYLALFLALGGVGYAKFALPAHSVGTKQLKSRAVTLTKIAGSARSSLRGAKGAQGAPCSPAVAGCRGPAGPGASALFVDKQQPFVNQKLATISAWTIQASCTDNAGSTTLSVSAVGPNDSIGDGEEDGHAYSNNSGSILLADKLVVPTNFGFHVSEITLHSPSKGTAHVSLFVYAQAPAPSFLCKVNGTAFPAG